MRVFKIYTTDGKEITTDADFYNELYGTLRFYARGKRIKWGICRWWGSQSHERSIRLEVDSSKVEYIECVRSTIEKATE